MDEEFKLCWKNFQDNIASGFQNLYDRGDLVDVTLACDGKLLHAHKIVLAICSPYFQQIFITNPCKHPIIILKDVTFNIMCELLEFMYQGVVNVKHAELQSFMKIGQLLQIKGLATNSSSSAASTSSEKSTSQTNNPDEQSRNNNENNAPNAETPAEEKSDNANEANPNPSLSTPKQNASNANRPRSPSTASPSTPSYPGGLGHHQANIKSENSPAINYITGYHVANAALKRQADFSGSETSSPLFSRKQLRRSLASAATDQNSDISDANESATGMDSMSNEDFLLPSISMVESRYDLQSLKREHSNSERDYREGGTASAAAVAAAASLRNTFGAPFGFDYNIYKNNNSNTNSGSGNNSAGSSQQTEYPNELHMPNDYSKNFGNHMEIPPIAPGEHWFQGNLEFMLSQRGKPLLVHDGHTFGIQYVRKDKKYWQCNLSRKYNCKARVTTTETGDIIVTNNEHCHTEIRQHLRKDYQRQKVMMNALINLSTNRLAENLRRHHQQANNLGNSLNHLQQSLTAPQCVSAGVGEIAPLAAHSATNNASSMQHLLNLGKFSATSEQTNLMNALQKRDDCGDIEPLDCGIRSTSIEGVKEDIVVVNDSNEHHQKHIEVNEKTNTIDTEEKPENFTTTTHV